MAMKRTYSASVRKRQFTKRPESAWFRKVEDVMKFLVAIDSLPVSKTVVDEVARRP